MSPTTASATRRMRTVASVLAIGLSKTTLLHRSTKNFTELIYSLMLSSRQGKSSRPGGAGGESGVGIGKSVDGGANGSEPLPSQIYPPPQFATSGLRYEILSNESKFNIRSFNVIEPLLSGIVLGLILVTLAGLFFAAYQQYKRGNQLNID